MAHGGHRLASALSSTLAFHQSTRRSRSYSGCPQLMKLHTMNTKALLKPAAAHVWNANFQSAEPELAREHSIEACWDRVAQAVSDVETKNQRDWRECFRNILTDFRFLPGGAILANAGTLRRNSLFSGYVMGTVEDSIPGVFNCLRECMLTTQSGAGASLDLSTLRPAGVGPAASGGAATGALSFLKVWEVANSEFEPGKTARGGLMASMRCDHPDIEAFIDAKAAHGGSTRLRLSVSITDDFMRAVEKDRSWPLVFPLDPFPVPAEGEVCERVWPGGSHAPQVCLVHRRISARALWDKILAAEHACAEPGVLYVDRINRDNNLWYCERLATTVPGGEFPLPPHGSCSTGSINLTRLVRDPFSDQSRMDMVVLRALAGVATRFLDNVHDLARFPLASQSTVSKAQRRIGLGVTGLADTLAMLGLHFGSPAGRDMAREIMQVVRDSAYQTSIELAQEKGRFAAFDKIKYGASAFVGNLPHALQDAIAQHGIRNSHLLAVAPTDTVNLLANNVSNGIEPMFAFKSVHRLAGLGGRTEVFEIENNAVHQYAELHGRHAAWPEHFVQSADIGAEDQLRMMATVQACVDQSVARTVRLPQSANAQEIGIVFRRAWELGLRGCAVARENAQIDKLELASVRADVRQSPVTARGDASLFH